MALDMRALYYIAMNINVPGAAVIREQEEQVKANENRLNQNFTILAQKIAEICERLDYLENQ